MLREDLNCGIWGLESCEAIMVVMWAEYSKTTASQGVLRPLPLPARQPLPLHEHSLCCQSENWGLDFITENQKRDPKDVRNFWLE